jgi:YfiH family protein
MTRAASGITHGGSAGAPTLSDRLAAAGLDWIVPEWPAPPGVHALSTTRRGGVSTGAAASMNLGLGGAIRSGHDDAQAVLENRRRLAALLPAAPAWLAQVHGANVAVLDPAAAAAARAPSADAAVTRERGVVCAVLTADCLPVLFADRRGRAIGVAHAGWRGLAAGVLGATVAALEALGAPARDLCAWLGPAIGPLAFEVGRDVRDAFAHADPGAVEACFAPHAEGKWRADLYALARRRLAAAGVADVRGGGFCTWRETERFYSYRRARDTGRMATLIWLAPARESATL